MWAVEQPRERALRALLAGTPWRPLGVLALGVGVALGSARAGYLGEGALSNVTLAAMQAALAITALGWARADDPVCPARALRLTVMPSRQALLVATVIGSGLGLHLLVVASRTLGYPVVVDHPARVLSALAYDVTGNVPAAELFFRGALFTRVERRWSLGAALLASTATCVLRYLLDPALPKIPEVMLGAIVYTGLLAVANGWLVWWSGSLVPPVIASLLFFIAYRTLSVE